MDRGDDVARTLASLAAVREDRTARGGHSLRADRSPVEDGTLVAAFASWLSRGSNLDNLGDSPEWTKLPLANARQTL